MKTIPVGSHHFAIVDDEDYEELSKYKWHLHNAGYASRNTKKINGKRSSALMHRQIMNPPNGMLVDHKNQERLDNRKENLRVCTQRENQFNTGAHTSEKRTSKYKGVCWSSVRNKWVVQVCGKYKRFDSEIEAARFYNKLAAQDHGEFAFLNNINGGVF